MTIKFNVIGTERKALVKAIETFTGDKAVYKYMPTCAYDIGTLQVDKEGTLHTPDDADVSRLELLVEHLTELGFAAELEQLLTTAPDAPQEADAAFDNALIDGLVVSMPLDGFTEEALDNLKKLVASKESLLKKAVCANELPIEVTETQVSFPWFSGQPDNENVQAYMQLIIALCTMAKNQKRITAKDIPTDNPKYTFRCFLLRLGFIGDEYKAARKILLKDFSGSSAFRNGQPVNKEVTNDEIFEM